MKLKSILSAAAALSLCCALIFTTSACEPRTQAAAQQSAAASSKTSESSEQTGTTASTTTLAQKLSAYEIELQDSTKAFSSNSGIRNYLKSWASSRDISCTTDAGGNIIMTRDSSKDYQKAAPTIIICPYDANQETEGIAPIASALYIMNNNEATGKLTVIFTQEKGHQFTGIKKLEKSLITSKSRIFYLNGTDKGQFSLRTASSKLMQFSNKLKYTKPEYALTYQVTIQGLDRGQANSDISDNTNAILRIKELLEYMKGANIGYNIASIQGGTNDGLSPGSCTVTFTVDPNRQDKFISHMDNVTERFNADRAHEHPGATYLYKKVTTPSKVIDTDSTQTMLAFMYTLMNGMYTDNKIRNNNLSDDPYSLNCVTYMKTDSEKFTINSVSNSLLDSDQTEIEDAQKKLAALTGTSAKVISNSPMWTGNENADFVSDVSTAYKAYNSSALKYSDSYASTGAGYMQKMNPKAQMVVLNVNDSVLEACTGTIIDYLVGSVSGHKDNLLSK
jgi:di/tripeptidase